MRASTGAAAASSVQQSHTDTEPLWSGTPGRVSGHSAGNSPNMMEEEFLPNFLRHFFYLLT